MNITFLIGNGFDLKIGMKTGYSHFYDYYLTQPNDNPIIKSFKDRLGKDLKKDSSYWSDLEAALGELTKEYTSVEDFDAILDDIREKISGYIKSEENKYHIDDIHAPEVIRSVVQIEDCLNTRFDQNAIASYKQAMIGEKDIDIISFNYTQSLEKLLGYSGSAIRFNSNYVLRGIQHLHGLLDLNMVLGVNDTSQIANKAFRTNPYILNALVKPEANKSVGHLIDRDCQVTIENSNLICLFGLSFGKTDQLWWEMIGRQLISRKSRLIIFVHLDNPPLARDGHKKTDAKEKIKSEFLSKTDLSPEEQESIRDRIFIGYSVDIFKIEVKEKTDK